MQPHHIQTKNYRPHFVGLNGHPYGAPIWVPYRAPISRFHFVKLLPLRGRHVCACGGQDMVHICSVPLRDFFSLRAPSGPKCPLRVHMGTL